MKLYPKGVIVSNSLMVPIHLDGLYLTHNRSVVGPMADFSRLPYRNTEREFNPDVANISEEIVAHPFVDRTLQLKSGIHLHWAMPDALTKGTDDTFPLVPNRWLITRRGEGQLKQWIIESNYLYPEGQGQNTGAITFPVEPTSDNIQPFRYMGRKIFLATWATGETPSYSWTEADPNSENQDYYQALTAMGYGEPTFAALYPNCLSVFGFYDDDYVDRSPPAELQYDLVGWYSDPTKDPLAQLDSYQTLTDTFGWAVIPENQPFSEQLLCYARLTIDTTNITENPTRNNSVEIAVGNSSTEALSAYLAHKLVGQAQVTGDRSQLEEQLEAVLLGPKLAGRQLDLGFKLKEARHEKGFSAVSGGTLWTIRPETSQPNQADATQEQVTLADAPLLAGLLNQLNVKQQAYDQALADLDSLRRQLFADWYKYMLSVYPPPETKGGYPDIAQVRAYIEQNGLLPLKQKVAKTGTLLLGQDSNNPNRVVAQAPGVATNALAAELAASLNALQATIDTYNQQLTDQNKPLQYRLRQTAGPRYWQPNEPVVLLVGEAVEATYRHSQDGRLRDDGLLECQILEIDLSQVANFQQITTKIDTLAPAENETHIGFSQMTSQPWHPILLEWEVELFPIKAGSNLDPARGAYAPDFVTANYEWHQQTTPDEHGHHLPGADLDIKLDKVGVVQGANIYRGRSILTPHALKQLGEKLNDFLEQQAEQQTIAGAVQQNLTAAQQYMTADTFHVLSQALSGFNTALLMHRQTLQLPIADPLGFDDYQPFTETVAALVQQSNRSAPRPQSDFNPFRSGVLKGIKLRLVDTFGQLRELQTGQVITTELFNVSDQPHLINLPPRLVQPTRLNFRWLAAEPLNEPEESLTTQTQDEPEMNPHPASSPICGWVLPNNLDNTLFVYNQQGQALGVLTPTADLAEATKARWLAAPGSPAAVAHPEQITNPHLRQVVNYLRDRGAEFLPQFILTLDSALEHIDPENFAHHEGLALLMGRPIAVTRAMLNLELRGRPALNESWEAFGRDLNSTQTEIDNQAITHPQRDSHEMMAVQIPIRLGEYQQLNDGLVGYWQERPDEAGYHYAEDIFYAPQSTESPSGHIQTHRQEAINLYQSLADPPQKVTLLLDPRGAVHATCGILPTKAIQLPPDQYATALKKIEVSFLTAPIVTRQDQLQLPLPTEPGYQWSWLHKENGAWQESTEIRAVELQATFQGQQQLKEGWLKLKPQPDTES